jgi:hypothetical protein
MHKFNNALFKSEHKSYYSKQDIDILDEYRTVVPIGLFNDVVEANDVIELDISKAFTHAFSQIVEIPIFNEFDSFTIYNNEPISLNNLYIVKVESGNLFFNKTYNLCYGKFISEFLAEAQIIAYKSPSFVKKVNYKKLVKTLFKTSITDDAGVDMYCKKLIANVNFGLLEKGQNKVQKSKIFNTLEEARFHQATYGGRVSILKRFHEEEIEEPLDFGLDVEKNYKFRLD